ncbi:hypothetical protein ABZ434_32405 [Streptomyces sp. NPDC005761]|uniref:hypothetical protein n=1 Tax=unclassified Streptomyces TaxID=2593676 RepID=UPI003403D1E1
MSVASATVLGGARGRAGRQAPFRMYGIGLLLAPAMVRVLSGAVPPHHVPEQT